MRALEIIRQKLSKALSIVHSSREQAVWRVVEALLTGGKLWGAALGRSLPGTATDKSNIKTVDRLVGNPLLYAELKIFYAAIASFVVRALWAPIILVDITEIRPGVCALSASIAHEGRGLPFYSIVRSKTTVTQRKCLRKFLRELEQILPPGVRPVVVTDAGFQSTWFDEVQDIGWDYVGRVRHRTRFNRDGRWVGVKALHKQATNRARSLGMVPFPRCKPRPRRLVLSKARTSQGRKRFNTRGTSGRTANDKRCQKSAREPWLLATSLSVRPDMVVKVYSFRMQIEQNYRDAKNHRWGWALDQNGTKDTCRLEIFLLIATLATLVQHTVGCAGENKQLQYRFQANTVRNRRVLSLFVLGRFLLQAKHRELLDDSDIITGLAVLYEKIRSLRL